MKQLLSSGQTIAHYRIVSHLGAGGMGEVYKAVDISLNRTVALKVLPAESVEDKNRMLRFVQEAKAASGLNHPHIVTIYEIGDARSDSQVQGVTAGGTSPENSTEDQPSTATIHYIAMEFIDGETLRSIIPRNSLKMRNLLGCFADIANGLAVAHSAGIVHRDLKPDNIMIRQDGYAKILDFGLAKLLEVSESLHGETTEIAGVPPILTQAGAVMGTLGYMSPEQVQGNPVDHRSDIFSFGCILFEAVTRKRAFDGISTIDTLHKILYSPVPAIGQLQSDAPAELQRIIRKCLAKEVDERYQSVKELANDLRELRRAHYEDTQLPSSAGAPASLTGQANATQKPLNTGLGPPRRVWLGSYPGFVLDGILLVAAVALLYVLFADSSSGRRSSVEPNPTGAQVFVDDEPQDPHRLRKKRPRSRKRRPENPAARTKAGSAAKTRVRESAADKLEKSDRYFKLDRDGIVSKFASYGVRLQREAQPAVGQD